MRHHTNYQVQERGEIVVGRGNGKMHGAEKLRLARARFPKESRQPEPTTYVLSVAMPNDICTY